MKIIPYKLNPYYQYLSCKYIVYTDYNKFLRHKHQRDILFDSNNSNPLNLWDVVDFDKIILSTFSNKSFFEFHKPKRINKQLDYNIIKLLTQINSNQTIIIEDKSEIESIVKFCCNYLNDVVISANGKIIIIFTGYYLTNTITDMDSKFSAVKISDNEIIQTIDSKIIEDIDSLGDFL